MTSEAKQVLEDTMDEVCAYADQLFEGTKARFALVVWPEGMEGDPNAIAIAAQPAAMTATASALMTAAEALVAPPDAAPGGYGADEIGGMQKEIRHD